MQGSGIIRFIFLASITTATVMADGHALVRRCDAVLAKPNQYPIAMNYAIAIRDLGVANKDEQLEARGLIRMAFAEHHYGIWGQDSGPWRRRAISIVNALESLNITRAEVRLFDGYLRSMYLHQMSEGIDDINAAITIGRALNDDALLAKAFCLLGRILPYDGKGRQGFECLQRGAAFAKQSGMPSWVQFAELGCYNIYQADDLAAYEAPDRLRRLAIMVSVDPAIHSSVDSCVEPARILAKRVRRAIEVHAIYVHPHEAEACLSATMFLVSYYKQSEDWANFDDYIDVAERSALVLQSEPKLQEVYVQRAAGLAQRGRFEEAIEAASRFIDHKKQLKNHAAVSRVYAYVAQHMAKGGNKDLALEWYGLSEKFREEDSREAYESLTEAAQQWVQTEADSRRLRDEIGQREASLTQSKNQFRLLLLAAPLAFVAIGFWLKLRHDRSEQQRLQRRVDEQTESLRIAKENAETANRAKTDYLARVNHELRNPLTAIVGSCEILSKQADANDVSKKCAETVKACSTVLVDVIDDVLDFTQIESGRVQLREVEFSLSSLLDAVQSIVCTKLSRGVQLSIELDPQLPETVLGDESKLRQVLVNLGLNAARHTKQGSIRFHCRLATESGSASSKQRVEFVVKDTGCGMDAKATASAFDQYKTHSTESGTGLGLYISRAFVECMGGEIRCESSANAGTTFTLQIPMRTPSADSMRTALISDSSPKARLDFLVIDDEIQNRETVTLLLETMGYESRSVSTWAEAKATLVTSAVTAVLMDLRMPEHDGYEMIKLIHGLNLAGRPRVFAMTGDATSANRLQTAAAGFDGFLAKPFTIANVNELIQSVQALSAKAA